ncbi:hypothetical protein FKN08_01915 [Vibrio sp. 1-2 (7-a)]|nr:hypothetical protein [Vibrio sp. 1-2 (7-a)]
MPSPIIRITFLISAESALKERVDAATAVTIGDTKRFIIFSLFIESAGIKTMIYEDFMSVIKV